MKLQKLNWQIWTGFLLSVFALVSYPLIFVRWPATRDFPWANLMLFAIAAVLVFVGVRRAFAPNRRRLSKVFSSILATLSVAILGLFVLTAFVMSRWLPAASGAPKVGEKAPAFSLLDTTGKTVSLSDLLTAPINGKPTKGALLIFYRGYW
jgi:hypothetical protein